MNFSSLSDEELWRQFRKSATAKPSPPKPVFENLSGFSWICRNRVGGRWRLVARLFEIMTGFFAEIFFMFITGWAIGFATVHAVFLPTGSWTLFLLATGVLAILILPQTPVFFCRAAFALRRRIFFNCGGRFTKRQCVSADDLPPELQRDYLSFRRALRHDAQAGIYDAQFVVLDCLLFGFGQHSVLSIEGFRRGYPVLAEHMVLEPLEQEDEDEEEPEEDEDETEDFERQD